MCALSTIKMHRGSRGILTLCKDNYNLIIKLMCPYCFDNNLYQKEFFLRFWGTWRQTLNVVRCSFPCFHENIVTIVGSHITVYQTDELVFRAAVRPLRGSFSISLCANRYIVSWMNRKFFESRIFFFYFTSTSTKSLKLPLFIIVSEGGREFFPSTPLPPFSFIRAMLCTFWINAL